MKSLSPPAMPLFSSFVKMIVETSHLYPDEIIGNGLIAFNRYRNIGKVIKIFKDLVSQPYQFHPVLEIQQYIIKNRQYLDIEEFFNSLPISKSIETSNTIISKESTNQFKLFVDLILNKQDKDEILNLTKGVVKEENSNFKNEMNIFQPSIHFVPTYEETLELDPKIQEIIGKEFPGCSLHHCTFSDSGIIDGSLKIISFGLVKDENCHNIFQFFFFFKYGYGTRYCKDYFNSKVVQTTKP